MRLRVGGINKEKVGWITNELFRKKFGDDKEIWRIHLHGDLEVGDDAAIVHIELCTAKRPRVLPGDEFVLILEPA